MVKGQQEVKRINLPHVLCHFREEGWGGGYSGIVSGGKCACVSVCKSE